MSDDGQIKSIIERVQRLQEEKRTIEDDIKEVYSEARGNGYDVKVLRAVVKHLGKDMEEVAEFDAIFDLYLQSFHAADQPSRAHVARDTGARTREAAQRQNPSEGEVGSAVRTGAPVSEIDYQPARLSAERDPQSVQHGSGSVGGAGGESPHSTTGSKQGSAAEPQARNEPGSESVASGGAGVTARPETPARKEYVLRPHCQRPEMCSSYGSKHCGPCERAAKATEDDDSADVHAFVRKTHDHIAMGEPA